MSNHHVQILRANMDALLTYNRLNDLTYTENMNSFDQLDLDLNTRAAPVITPECPPSLPSKSKAGNSTKLALSDEEEREFRKLDAIVRNDLSSNLEAAKALFTMKANKLFYGHGNSLKAYGQTIGISPSYATRMVQTGRVYFKLEPCWKVNPRSRPTSAWQLRALCCIKDENILRSTWENAVKQSAGASPKASLVEACASGLSAQAKPKPSSSKYLKLDIGSIPGLIEELEWQAKEENLTIAESALGLFAAFVEIRSECYDNSPHAMSPDRR